MMEKLHHDGELEVKVEEDDKEMLILFTYDVEDMEKEEEKEEYTIEEDIKEEFSDFFDEIINKYK